ncbi:hypothetical protein [Spirosoma validum]|uniref:DUF4345 domain-containing protein n=1 Tax=Spirosoma validum TaxID=2771355 RepID=A0A927B6V4_9BACT|nr:hypothetical protein [Spirosoma validum]MBD2756785.1 hypothetical protein [Spirosoma validum]
MNLTRLLILHAVVTFAAGVVLIVTPGLIPGSVNIHLNPEANLLCYLLGACEVSLAVLSYYGTKLRNVEAIQLICLTFIVLHSLTAAVEIYAFSQGASAKIWGNIALRIVVSGLFIYYGIAKKSKVL